MSDNIEGIKKYRELLAQLDPAAEEALELIKDGNHKKGYDKIIEIMDKCDYSHPKGWAYMSILAIRQGAANKDSSLFKPAESGFKKAVDFYTHISDNKNGLFELGNTIFDNISKYSDIHRLNIKNDTSAAVMSFLDEAKDIPDNGYNSTRQKEQLTDLQIKIDKRKEQGRLDICTTSLNELAVYEHFLNKVREIDAFDEKSIKASQTIKEKVELIEKFDKDYIIDSVLSSCGNIKTLIEENISYSQKAAECRLKRKKEEAINRYWAEHSEEKAELDRRLETAKQEMKKLDEQFGECEKEYAEINKKRDKFVSGFDEERKSLELDRDELNGKINALGLFKSKDKKALSIQLDEVNSKLDEVNKKIAEERNAYNESIDKELILIAEKKKALADKDNELNSEIKHIKEELTKDR